jgi:nucleoside-diphosphate-sugar epimerase
MYGKVKGWMTEDTPYNPSSKKGEIRAQIATLLMDEVLKGNITAQIARSADFYGKSNLSYVAVMVFENFAKQKRAQYMISEKFKHSYTFIPDAGKATALLANTDSAYNQVWHLPTDKNVLTGKEFIQLAADVFDCKPDYMVLKKWMIKFAAIANPIIKETLEMLYQLEDDYLFDSSKFDNAFDFKATSYRNGLIETALSYGV